MGQRTGKKYCPSNGTDGMIFQGHYCDHCLHDKFNHTQDFNDKQCEILNQAFLIADSRDPAFPKEWQYDENDRPTCTAYVKWDWGRDDDEGGINEPPIVEPPDPAQLCFPFMLEEIENNVKEVREKVFA